MPRIVPIPPYLLNDSMAVYLPDEAADYGGKYLEDPVTVGNVRFERSETLNPSAFRLADGAKGRVWVDAANSPGAFAVPVGAKVVIGDEAFVVAACAELAPFGKVHHWELDVK